MSIIEDVPVPIVRLSVDSVDDLPEIFRAVVALRRSDGSYQNVTYEEFFKAMQKCDCCEPGPTGV